MKTMQAKCKTDIALLAKELAMRDAELALRDRDNFKRMVSGCGFLVSGSKALAMAGAEAIGTIQFAFAKACSAQVQ